MLNFIIISFRQIKNFPSNYFLLSKMLIKEYRVVMPMTVDEYHIGQLYSVADASLNETGGGEGVEVVRNVPFQNFPLLGEEYSAGQYTLKKYHLESRIPKFIRMLLPKGATDIEEQSWNAHPYCRTVITNPSYMKENFAITIETLHLNDRGTSENVHQLPEEKLRQREVITIDIASDPILPTDFRVNEDPTRFVSRKTNRGPLGGNWMEEVEPVMTCYKLVTVEFKWFGVQNRVERFIQHVERRIFTNFHRQVFCWMDKWYGLTMEQIREIEDRTQEDLNKARINGALRGMKDFN